MKFLKWLAFALALAAAASSSLTDWRESLFQKDHPAPGKRVDVCGTQVHLIDRGSGAPVVFLHGNPGLALDFELVSGEMVEGRRFIAVDRPGYGWSGRPRASMSPIQQAGLIHGALQKIGVEKPVLVGFSFGGITSLAYAIAHPNEVRALVLVAPVADPVAGHPPSFPQRILATQALGPLFAWVIASNIAPGAIDDGFRAAFAPEPVVPLALQRGQLHFRRPGNLLASANDWATLEGELPGLAARYAEIQVPIELLLAGGDQIVGPSHGAAIVRVLPQTHAVTVPGWGHQIPNAHPDAIVGAVERALARTEN